MGSVQMGTRENRYPAVGEIINIKSQPLPLFKANLSGEILTDCMFNEDTILPDGKNWTTDTDMRRFTEPEKPD